MFVFKGEHFFVYHGCGGVHGARVPACRFVGKSKKAKRPLFGTAGVSRCERAIVASYTAAGLRLAVAAPLPALPFDGGGGWGQSQNLGILPAQEQEFATAAV